MTRSAKKLDYNGAIAIYSTAYRRPVVELDRLKSHLSLHEQTQAVVERGLDMQYFGGHFVQGDLSCTRPIPSDNRQWLMSDGHH